MTPRLVALAYPATAGPTPKKGLQLAKTVSAGLGLLMLANILVLGLVGLLKGTGVPKSLANPLQLLYLPLMWGGLRWLKRTYHLAPALPVRRPVGAAGRVLLALLLVAATAAGIVALLQYWYGLGASYGLLTTEVYRWVFMALMLGTAAAVEELLFRDYLLKATLKATQNFYVLAFANASLFLLLHLQGFLLGGYTPLWGLGVFSIGLFLAAYVLVFQDLVFPICFHAFWNISTTLYVEDDQAFSLVKFNQYRVHELLIANVTATVCTGVALSLFGLLAYGYHRRHRPQPVGTKAAAGIVAGRE